MATFAAYPEWFERCNIQKECITEVAFVRSYIPGANEVSWDASASMDGSVMAYLAGTKITIVCASLTEVPEKMFARFTSLQKASGLQDVTRIGAWAFMHTPVLASIDIVPEKLSFIDHDAFKASDIEDYLDLSNVSLDKIGARATRRKRWSEAGLATLQSVTFPAGRILFDVANPDSQLAYPDVPYATQNGNPVDVATAACRTLTCYHAWNCLYAGTDKEYPNFITWFNDKLNADGKYAETTDIANDVGRLRDYATLGWEQTAVEKIDSKTQLEYILSELNNGFPVYLTLRVGNGYHSVLCIGCDASTRKLAIVDSIVSESVGIVYWNKYEDLFMEGSTDVNEVVRKLDYNLPVLAPSVSWYTQGGTTIARSTITEIDIVRSYTPSGNETASWDASVKKNGSVMAYVNGTKLTIAGNGDICVYAHPNSTAAFSDPNNTNVFSAVTAIRGLDILNTIRARALNKMFSLCGSLVSADVANWNTSACTNMTAMFQNCYNLKTLDLSKWDVSKVTEMNAMFQSSTNKEATCMHLESIGDVGNWNTSNVTGMQQMFKDCKYLKELNVRNWDTSKVGTLRGSFLRNACRLEKFTAGEKFDIDADDLDIPAPSTEYHILADGNWYDADHNAYTSISPNVERTYYASPFIAVGDDDTLVFVRNGTLKQMAFAVRYKNGKSNTMLPSEFAEEVLAMEIATE